METINPILSSPMMEQAKQAQELKKFKESANQLENAAKTSADNKNDAKLKNACKQFEALFLDLMYKEMRKTVPKDPLLGDSNADNILRSMHDTQMTKELADAGGMGLADMMYKQIKRENVKQPLTAVAHAYKK
ncbi:rod-binding protein [Pectinatus sottacetonis]|uniref:rod-binding protein n=1 Tax=Pectinatus sottacetonis TaxID=1002795 RepID=UPI0018C5F635|nr:rod-binding protein [Pectinatus sottacetonis]